jgi:hypothetical protein
MSGDARTSWNLLATGEEAEQRSDWFNRGRMTSGELWGECGKNADYGRIRRFRLRGMLITFGFDDIQWDSASEHKAHPLKRFVFKVTFVAEKNADTATAERVKTPRPPKSCYQ